jgi:outer membrane lipoprotein-sorting protein
MMRWSVLLTAAVCVVVWAGLGWADDLESVQKELAAKGAAMKSCTYKSTSTIVSEAPVKSRTETVGTDEMLKKDGKWLHRMDSKSTTVMEVGGEEQKTESTVLVVSDEKYTWTLTDSQGRKVVVKNKLAEGQNMAVGEGFEALRKDYDLKLLPDETVEGKPAWVIEATPKKGTPAAQTGMTMRYYYDKGSGMMVKMAGKTVDGKTTMTSIVKDLKVNPDISADRFVFKVPEGVHVIDMTSSGQPQDQPAPEAESEPEPESEQPKEKEKESKSKGLKLPKIPGL